MLIPDPDCFLIFIHWFLLSVLKLLATCVKNSIICKTVLKRNEKTTKKCYLLIKSVETSQCFLDMILINFNRTAWGAGRECGLPRKCATKPSSAFGLPTDRDAYKKKTHTKSKSNLVQIKQITNFSSILLRVYTEK